MIWTLKIITHLVQLCTIAVITWYLVQNNLKQPYRFFAAGWLLILAFDLTMVVIGLITKPVSNHWIYNIGFPLENLVMIWFFCRLTSNRQSLWLMAVFGIFAVVNLFFIQGKTTLNTYSLAVAGIIILIMAIIRMYELYKEDTPDNLFAEPDFWYCTGFILYWGLATPYFAMVNYLWQNFEEFTTYYFYTFTLGCTTLLNLSIIKALLCHRQNKKKYLYS